MDTGIRPRPPPACATANRAAAEPLAGADVDAELVDMGPEIPPMFTVRDPDGNTLYVVERD